MEVEMTASDIVTLYDYGYWANRKLMATISRLSEEEFTGKPLGADKSIRTLLVHILSAEWGWFARCGGPERDQRLLPEDFPSLESIQKQWSKIETSLRSFLSELEDSDLNRVVTYALDEKENLEMPLGEILQHAANHAVHHRGQISLMLRTLGYNPEGIDILLYYGEKRGTPVW